MQRLAIHWMIGLSAVFLLPLWLIQAQPYDASSLSDLLAPPPDCQTPCFLGIRPGETTLNDAALLLDQNPLVRFVILSDEFNVHNTRTRIIWEYRQPQRVVSGNIYLDDYIVRRITIYDIPLGEVWLAMGQPDISYFIGEDRADAAGNLIHDPVMHIGYYVQHDLRVDSPAACVNFWSGMAHIYVTQTERAANTERRLSETRLPTFRRQSCRAVRRNHTAFLTGSFLNRLPQSYQVFVEAL
jgi:hypothetical protein